MCVKYTCLLNYKPSIFKGNDFLTISNGSVNNNSDPYRAKI